MVWTCGIVNPTCSKNLGPKVQKWMYIESFFLAFMIKMCSASAFQLYTDLYSNNPKYNTSCTGCSPLLYIFELVPGAALYYTLLNLFLGHPFIIHCWTCSWGNPLLYIVELVPRAALYYTLLNLFLGQPFIIHCWTCSWGSPLLYIIELVLILNIAAILLTES